MRMPCVRGWLLTMVLVALTAGCEDTVEIPPVPPSCGHLFREDPAGSVVIPVGGSRRLRVRFAEEGELPRGEDFSHCPQMSLEWFQWSVDHPDVARVEPYSEAVVTITGLAVGETLIRLQYGELADIQRAVPLEVVAPSTDADDVSSNLAEPDRPQHWRPRRSNADVGR